MVALLAFGGTYAFFTATANDQTGKVTTATIALSSAKSELTMGGNYTNLLPYEEVTAKAELTNASTRASFAFVTLEYDTISGGEFTLKSVTSTTDGITWTKITDGNKEVYGVKLASSVTAVDVVLTFKFVATAVNDNGAGHALMNAELDITITAGSIQEIAENGSAFADINAAYEAYKIA